GSTWGITDDGYSALPAGGLGAQLTAAGVSWRAYMEGLTSAGCMRSPYPYALKHNPFAYYGGSCPDNVVSLDALDADLAHDTPRFVWITPGLCHDGHDCALAESGPWLESLVAKIVASSAWRDGGALFIVWDEGDGRSSIVPLIVATHDLAGRRVDASYDHYSLLAAIEDAFGLHVLGAARGAFGASVRTIICRVHVPRPGFSDSASRHRRGGDSARTPEARRGRQGRIDRRGRRVVQLDGTSPRNLLGIRGDAR